MKYLDLSSKSRTSPKWLKFAAASLVAAAIAGCGGGGTGANTTTPGTNPAAVANMAASTWQAMSPTVDPASISVSIPADGKPVVTFKVTDGKGNPAIGLGGQINGTATALPTDYNLQFTLAKLIPADANGPSKWVSYLVTKPTVAAGAVSGWAGTYPTSDANGTLVDNNDGTYKYTFLRDITAVQAQVNALVDSGTNLKADLDAANLAYDATATHRLGIIITGSQPGTGTNTPTKVQTVAPVPLLSNFNIGFDFVPNGAAVTATRDIVMKSSCAACHDNGAIGHRSANNATATAAATNGIPAGTFVGRNDPRLCVTCHTDQTKYGFAEAPTTATGYDDTSAVGYKRVNGQAAFTYPRMIHQTHMGDKLVKTGYNLNAHAKKADGTTGCDATSSNAGQCFNLIGLPQDVTNCAMCHDGNATKSDGSVNANKTADGNNWMSKPSIIACGACHDGINFADGTGFTVADMAAYRATTAYTTAVTNGTTLPALPTPTGHLGGSATNGQCANCHATGGGLTAALKSEITLVHRSNFGTLNNATPPAGVANIAYNISSVTVNAAGNPVIKFRIMKTVNGTAAAVTSLPLPATDFLSTTTPSVYVAYAVPQDGIAAPADFNVTASSTLANLLDTTKGNLGNTAAATTAAPVAADASGYFTATLTGTATAPIKLPANATLVTGVLLGHFVQLPASSGQAANINVLSRIAMKAQDGTAGRRAVVASAKCDSCHAQLGTDPSFHSGDRNDPQACNLCHNGNRTSSGWAVDSSTFVHGLHATDKRTVPYNWQTGSMLGKGMYPGVLKNCNQCHLPNTVNFSATSNAVPNLLWSGVATGKFVAAGTANVVSYTWTAGVAGTPGYGGVDGAPTCVVKAATNSATVAANLSPWVSYGTSSANATDYGVGFTTGLALASGAVTNACNASGVPYTVAAGTVRQADGATLVNSPIASACASCHTTTMATAHMKQNGGSLYVTRASVSDANGNLVSSETCLTCHAAGKVADAAAVHGAQ